MIAALLTAAAVWCLVSPSPKGRLNWLAGVPPSPRSVSLAVVGAMLTPLGGVVVLGPMWGLLLGLAAARPIHRAISRLETAADRRRADAEVALLPMALDLMVSALEAGLPAVGAFTVVADATAAPLGPELALVAHRLHVAADHGQVWGMLADHATLAPVGRAFARAERSGMPVAEVVATVAAELRRERIAERKRAGAKVAVRTAAPLGLCFLPAFFLIGIVPVIVSSFSTMLP